MNYLVSKILENHLLRLVKFRISAGNLLLEMHCELGSVAILDRFQYECVCGSGSVAVCERMRFWMLTKTDRILQASVRIGSECAQVIGTGINYLSCKASYSSQTIHTTTTGPSSYQHAYNFWNNCIFDGITLFTHTNSKLIKHCDAAGWAGVLITSFSVVLRVTRPDIFLRGMIFVVVAALNIITDYAVQIRMSILSCSFESLW